MHCMHGLSYSKVWVQFCEGIVSKQCVCDCGSLNTRILFGGTVMYLKATGVSMCDCVKVYAYMDFFFFFFFLH